MFEGVVEILVCGEECSWVIVLVDELSFISLEVDSCILYVYLCLFLGLCGLVLLCRVGFCRCVDFPMVGVGSDGAAGHLWPGSPF